MKKKSNRLFLLLLVLLGYMTARGQQNIVQPQKKAIDARIFDQDGYA